MQSRPTIANPVLAFHAFSFLSALNWYVKHVAPREF